MNVAESTQTVATEYNGGVTTKRGSQISGSQKMSRAMRSCEKLSARTCGGHTNKPSGSR